MVGDKVDLKLKPQWHACAEAEHLGVNDLLGDWRGQYLPCDLGERPSWWGWKFSRFSPQIIYISMAESIIIIRKPVVRMLQLMPKTGLCSLWLVSFACPMDAPKIHHNEWPVVKMSCYQVKILLGLTHCILLFVQVWVKSRHQWWRKGQQNSRWKSDH